MTVERGVAELGPFEFECGRSIPTLEVAYEAYGEFDGRDVVLVCHALTGSQHVADPVRSGDEYGDDAGTAGQARAWWDAVVGPGKAIDTTEYYVICANVPGSCYGTTGPSTPNPETGVPYGSDFPPVTVGDWTRAQRHLLDHLGVGRLHAVVGGSVGGMNALDWAVRYPDDVDRVVPVAAAARLDPQSLALDAIARRAITSDPDWRGGDYYGSSEDDGGGDGDGDDGDGEGGGTHPDRGMGLARQIGHVMYLSKESMAQKFGRRTAGRGAGSRRSGGDEALFPPDPAAGFFPYREVESYLDYQAEKFAERFDANSYLLLTRAMDAYDLATGYDSDADALAAFDGEALLISFTGDWHFTVDQSDALARAFRDAGVDVAHHVVESDHGHDAFLVEPEKVGPPLESFLADGVAGRAVTDALPEPTDDGRTPEFAPVHSSLFQG